MILNVPRADELRAVSLRLYFKAWSEITDICTEWEEYCTQEPPPWTSARGAFYLEAGDNKTAREWDAYMRASQSDLESVYTLVQQSQEIGLKAMICDVSPFLLLRKAEAKAIDAAGIKWDFTDFPTIDAVDLPRYCNIFRDDRLSAEFVANYQELRKNRNKISHLGIYRQGIDPSAVMDVLFLQYTELYRGRSWMKDRLELSSTHRLDGFAYSGDTDWSPKINLFRELWHLLPGLSDSQFGWLMQHPRSEPRYICHECAVEGAGTGSEPYGSDVPTAYMTSDEAVRCVVCRKTSAVRRGPCPAGCGCEYLSDDKGSDGLCMRCGS